MNFDHAAVRLFEPAGWQRAAPEAGDRSGDTEGLASYRSRDGLAVPLVAILASCIRSLTWSPAKHRCQLEMMCPDELVDRHHVLYTVAAGYQLRGIADKGGGVT